MQPAAASCMPLAAPQETNAAGTPMRRARYSPDLTSRSGRSTYAPAAARIASSTSAGIRLPPSVVMVPLALMKVRRSKLLIIDHANSGL